MPGDAYPIDIYRCMHPSDQTAARFALGPDQETWLKSSIVASDARWKLVVTHHPLGGRGPTENYGRGGVGVAEMVAYDWYDLPP